jgi:hypothetical protein
LRSEETLRSWGAPDAVCLAGLCHACYGTAGFTTALLPLSLRSRLQGVIGVDAEAIVYRYASCDRPTTYAALGPELVPFRDRFTGVTENVSAEAMHEFAIITIANEFDLVRHGAFAGETLAVITDLFESLAPYAPDAARAALAESASR